MKRKRHLSLKAPRGFWFQKGQLRRKEDINFEERFDPSKTFQTMKRLRREIRRVFFSFSEIYALEVFIIHRDNFRRERVFYFRDWFQQSHSNLGREKKSDCKC